MIIARLKTAATVTVKTEQRPNSSYQLIRLRGWEETSNDLYFRTASDVPV